MALTRAERTTASCLVVVGTFQAALAAGAPWGRASYGGSHAGVLPGRLRGVSGVAAVGYGVGAALVLQESGSAPARARGLAAVTALMGLGVLANGASRSPVERALWTPVSAIAAAAAWQARAEQR